MIYISVQSPSGELRISRPPLVVSSPFYISDYYEFCIEKLATQVCSLAGDEKDLEERLKACFDDCFSTQCTVAGCSTQDLQAAAAWLSLLVGDPSPEDMAKAKERITKLINRIGCGAWGSFCYFCTAQCVLDHYDKNHDEQLDRDELIALLKDAGIGNRITRGGWADGIIRHINNHDGGSGDTLSWDEIRNFFQNHQIPN